MINDTAIANYTSQPLKDSVSRLCAEVVRPNGRYCPLV